MVWEDFRAALRDFVRAYSLLAQIVPFKDTGLEALYSYGKFLILRLPRTDGAAEWISMCRDPDPSAHGPRRGARAERRAAGTSVGPDQPPLRRNPEGIGMNAGTSLTHGPQNPDQQPGLFELDRDEPLGLDDEPATPVAKAASEAKKSIQYMLGAAMQYGGVRDYVDLLDRVAALDQYKPFNALLVLLQRPSATFLLPAHQWMEKYGRVPRPGQQPLVMLQPRGPVMFLFDVSQTEAPDGGKTLPLHLRNPFATADMRSADSALGWLTTNAKGDGVRVSPAGHGLRSAGCIWATDQGMSQSALMRKRPDTYGSVPVHYETLLNDAYSATERLATLAHELGHLYCGHIGTHDTELWRGRPGLSTPLQELEAESVAWIVFKRLAPGVDLPEYLKQYFRKGEPRPEADIERVLVAAGRVIEMSQGFAPRRSKTKADQAGGSTLR